MFPASFAAWVGDAEWFAEAHWQRHPALLHPGEAATPVITLDEVDSALTGGLLHGGYVDMAHPGRTVPRETFCRSHVVNHSSLADYADGAGIGRMVRGGATLILRSVDHWHRGVAELTAGLMAGLGRRTDAAFFVTPPHTPGLDLHRDDADAFVLQVSGSKQWRVHACPTDGDWETGTASETAPPVLTARVRPGDVLYIPRGAPHTAFAGDGLSAHLTVFIHEVSARHLYTALQRMLIVGLALPPRPVGDAALGESAQVLLDQLTKGLAEVSAEDVVEAARRALLAAVPQLHVSPGLAQLAREERTAQPAE